MIKDVIKPPQPLCTTIKNATRIFLAGSIEMGKAREWQNELTKGLGDAKANVVLYNPRREDWDENWEQSMEGPEFYQQVNWEMNALDKCDMIFMFFDPKAKSPISLLELGLYASSGKMTVCCPKKFWRRGNVEAVCERYGIPLYDDFDVAKNDFINKFSTTPKSRILG